MSTLTRAAVGPNADPAARAAVIAALRRIDQTGSMAGLTSADLDAAHDHVRRTTLTIAPNGA